MSNNKTDTFEKDLRENMYSNTTLTYQLFENKYHRKELKNEKEFVEDMSCVIAFISRSSESCYVTKHETGFIIDPIRKFYDYHLGNYVFIGEGKNKKKVTFKDMFIDHKIKISRSQIIFRPNFSDPNIFNLYLPPIHNSTNTTCDTILTHIREVLADNDPISFDYIVKWLAHIVQIPEQKTGTVLVFKSGQGTGKSLFGNLLHKYVFGEHLVAIINNLQNIVGKFNTITMNKILTIMDNVNNQIADILGSVITGKVRIFENKFKDPIILEDYNNLIFFSNHLMSVKIDQDDRRYAIFECSPSKIGNIQYFDKLVAAIKNEASAFYYYLKNLDITNFQIQHIPLTRSKKELFNLSKSSIETFVTDKLNITGTIHSIKEIYTMYNTYCQKENYKPSQQKILKAYIKKKFGPALKSNKKRGWRIVE